jgi:hypothetical protein
MYLNFNIARPIALLSGGLALVSLAYSDPADRVNGTATIVGPDFRATLEINAQEGTGNKAKGSLKFYRANEAFEGTVTYANIVGNTAYVAVKIGKATNIYWTGRWVFMKIVDGGQPRGQDWVWMGLADKVGTVAGVIDKLNPSEGPYKVTSGNLHVHSR